MNIHDVNLNNLVPCLIFVPKGCLYYDLLCVYVCVLVLFETFLLFKISCVLVLLDTVLAWIFQVTKWLLLYSVHSLFLYLFDLIFDETPYSPFQLYMVWFLRFCLPNLVHVNHPCRYH